MELLYIAQSKKIKWTNRWTLTQLSWSIHNHEPEEKKFLSKKSKEKISLPKKISRDEKTLSKKSQGNKDSSITLMEILKSEKSESLTQDEFSREREMEEILKLIRIKAMKESLYSFFLNSQTSA